MEKTLMKNINKEQLTANMADNLPVLRAKLGLTQEELSILAGISRHTVISVESKKRELSWSTFLALAFIFANNEATTSLLNILGILNEDLYEYIKVVR
ncbi:MAG: hypothetical protein GX264_02115 [Clostridiales bacterium]|nr:hypothetical protein [Clostridiales bacterium]